MTPSSRVTRATPAWWTDGQARRVAHDTPLQVLLYHPPGPRPVAELEGPFEVRAGSIR